MSSNPTPNSSVKTAPIQALFGGNEQRSNARSEHSGQVASRSIEIDEAALRREAAVRMRWGVKVPLRDGVNLNATLYLPGDHADPGPVICTITPYTGQMWHDRGLYFASNGFAFAAIDVRGRGNSEGTFQPLLNDASDGFDVVQWLARQPFCNGKVALWGGSYGGYLQWATAKEFPEHLSTIAPVASVHPGVDFPVRGNIARPYLMQWLTLVSGLTLQDHMFGDQWFWRQRFRSWFESGVPFRKLDQQLGNPSRAFQQWLDHPEIDEFWERLTPDAGQYAKISIPVLTITGIYDADQPGSLAYYRKHLDNASSEASANHYLVIGPWDHPGTRDPKAEFCGLKLGPASVVDLNKLHLQWYEWTMRGGQRPEFLLKRVAYYVMGAEKWRYADALDDVTAHYAALYLSSSCNPTDVFSAGALSWNGPAVSEPDHYVHDPRDVSLAALESTIDPYDRTDQRMLHAWRGRQLIYHSEPFEEDIEISGFFRFTVWIAIDQPDTDIRVAVYDVHADGTSVLMSSDSKRARYRESLRQARLIRTDEPQCFEFDGFTFVSRVLRKGHRLRLAVGPLHSIFSQKNYNSGGMVSEESIDDARPVTVTLFHDELRPSALRVPFGQPE